MKKMTFPRPALLAALVAATCCSSAYAGKTVSWEDLLNDDKTPQDVLSYGLGLKAQRHSTLAKVNTRNVANLVPAWSFSFGGEKQRGQEGQALVHDLTPREFEVLRMLAHGSTAADIAGAMHLSTKTIFNYLSLIRQKLDADSDFKLLHLAAHHGLVDMRNPLGA